MNILKLICLIAFFVFVLFAIYLLGTESNAIMFVVAACSIVMIGIITDNYCIRYSGSKHRFEIKGKKDPSKKSDSS